jgi:hypothetical protein
VFTSARSILPIWDKVKPDSFARASCVNPLIFLIEVNRSPNCLTKSWFFPFDTQQRWIENNLDIRAYMPYFVFMDNLGINNTSINSLQTKFITNGI